MTSKRTYGKILTVLSVVMLAGSNVPRSSLKLPPLSENSTAAIAATPQSWENAKLIQTLPGHSTGRMIGVRFLSFSADGQQLITGGIGGEQPNANGSYEGTIKRWNPETGVLLPSVPGVFDESTFVAVSPDRKTLVTWSRDGSLKLRELETGKVLRTFSWQREPELVRISRDGQLLVASSSDMIKVWNLSNGKLIQTFKARNGDYLSKVALSPDGQTMVTTGLEKTIKLWDVGTGKLLRSFSSGHQYPLHSFAFSPDGKTLASGSVDNTIKLWDWRSGKLLKTLSGQSEAIISLVFSPDGQVLASANAYNSVKLWNLKTGKLIRTLSEGKVADSASEALPTFSPDGRMLASGTYDGKIEVWRVAP